MPIDLIVGWFVVFYGILTPRRLFNTKSCLYKIKKIVCRYQFLMRGSAHLFAHS